MRSRGRDGAGLRRWVWLAGAAISLGGYFSRAICITRRTPVGLERRLFGLGNLDAKLLESPSGGRWMLVQDAGDDFPYTSPKPPSPTTLWERLQSFRWPDDGRAPRTLSLSVDPGTWELHGNAVHQVWGRTTKGWLDDRQLWSGDDGPPPAWVLDLRTGRAAQGVYAAVAVQRYRKERDEWDAYAADDPYSADRLLHSTLSTALEELPRDLAGTWDAVHASSAGKRVDLVFSKDLRDEPVTLYAVSDDPTPRILRLAQRARPLALGHDGRTLFFERNGALWRLDLRKPLPALLAEAPPPELPDPLVDR